MESWKRKSHAFTLSLSHSPLPIDRNSWEYSKCLLFDENRNMKWFYFRVLGKHITLIFPIHIKFQRHVRHKDPHSERNDFIQIQNLPPYAMRNPYAVQILRPNGHFLWYAAMSGNGDPRKAIIKSKTATLTSNMLMGVCNWKWKGKVDS